VVDEGVALGFGAEVVAGLEEGVDLGVGLGGGGGTGLGCECAGRGLCGCCAGRDGGEVEGRFYCFGRTDSCCG
jgi:hypothetical protein